MWFISLLCLQLPAYSFQIEPKVSISGNYTIQKIFEKIEQQTGKRIFYANSILDDQEKINLKAVNITIAEVLSQILTGKKLEWSIEPKFITIVEIKNQPKPKTTLTKADTTIPVTGRVTNEKGEPIAGATVQVKGTKYGVSTGIDGTFSLHNIIPKSTLTVSSIQYQTTQVPASGKVMVIQLQESVSDLDETVIIAYGSTTKRYATGNISTVKAKDIEKQPVNNPILALQGRVPGLFITQENGIPGGGITVRIQGQNSIGNGNDPLYIINGVPYASQMLATTTNFVLGSSGGPPGSGQGNPLSYINPADIESIDVLKDADATAIYGSRAANGAILISTKKGKAGKTSTSFNLQSGWGKASGKINMMNTPQYLEMRREAFINDHTTTPEDNDYDVNGLWDTTRNTDWQKEFLGGIAKYTIVNGSVSGGTASVQYLIGATYRKETSMFPGSFADNRGSIHFNLNNISIDKKFRLELSGNYLFDNNQLPFSDMITTALTLAPNAPHLYNADGSLNWQPNSLGASSWDNPLLFIISTYQNKTSNLLSNLIMSYEILPGLEVKSSFGYNNLLTKEFTGFPLESIRPEKRSYTPRSAIYSNSTISSWIAEPQISYKKDLRNSKLNILLGGTIQQNNNNGENFTGTGYNNNILLKDVLSATDVTINNTVAAIYKYAAFFGRINYNVADKYIINLTARRDGSSRFGSKSQFHDFGAVGVAWIFSEEDLIKNNLPILSFGKLRGSYGTTGNDQIADYGFLNLYTPINFDVPYQEGSGLTVNNLTNPYLQWEETRKFQFGIELGFGRDKLLFTGNYIRNRSSNQLLEYSLPTFTGFGSIQANFPATVQNNAWEFSVITRNINSKFFHWNSNINLTIPKNKLISFSNLAFSSYANGLIIGQPIDVIRRFRFAGVDPATGKYQFSDHTGKITSSPDYDTDMTELRSYAPQYYGGFENTFSWKGFELDLLFQLVKQKREAYTFGYGPYQPGKRLRNQPASLLNRWQKEGDITNIERFSADFSIYDQYNYVSLSDANFIDASYIRLKNVSLSYQLPANWTSKMRLTNCKLAIQGQNLLTFTNYTGIDPETNINPVLKVLNCSLQVGF
jgi:TonB-linked SusC/RagA family outer membrane protein